MQQASRPDTGRATGPVPSELPRGARGVLETGAERLMVALQAVVVAGSEAAPDAEKYSNRLGFALGRVEELRAAALAGDGVFTPARLDVAMTVLETHVRTAAAFIERTVRPMRQHAARREAPAAADEAVALVEQREERAA